MFILSRNVSAFVNFLLTIGLFLIFCIFDHIQFGWHFLLLIFPIACELVMNIGIGMILSVWNIFFRDTEYLYDVFLTLLNYVSAIFYTVDRFGAKMQSIFLLNPVYVIIKYFRMITIDGIIPSLQYHALMIFYALFFLLFGLHMYKKYNHQFIYYI
jgi:ABC-2 type transport system permease protein